MRQRAESAHGVADDARPADRGAERVESASPRSNEPRVPHRAQVRAATVEPHLVRVPALVVGVARVQRLVDVANEMDKVLERDEVLGVRSLRGQDRLLAPDRTDDAVAVWAVARCHVDAVSVTREVHVVPASRFARTGPIGPRRDRNERGAGSIARSLSTRARAAGVGSCCASAAIMRRPSAPQASGRCARHAGSKADAGRGCPCPWIAAAP